MRTNEIETLVQLLGLLGDLKKQRHAYKIIVEIYKRVLVDQKFQPGIVTINVSIFKINQI
jgi:hypothetical protein